MLKNLKLGTKIGGGFGIVLLLSAVIALVGWSGMAGVVDRVEKVGTLDWIVKQLLEVREDNKSYIINNDQQYFEAGKVKAGELIARTRELKDGIRDPVEYLWQVSDPPGIVYDRQGLAFVRIGPGGLVWHSRRISWDGFRDVVFTADRITGLAYLPSSDDRWYPFELELATGRSSGGSYSSDDAAQWEQLADE